MPLSLCHRSRVHSSLLIYNYAYVKAMNESSLTECRVIMGPLMGGPDVACQFLKIAMSHVSFAYFPPCHMSNFRNIHVSCHSLFLTPCDMSRCSKLNLRKTHVAVSNLGSRAIIASRGGKVKGVLQVYPAEGETFGALDAEGGPHVTCRF